jgi:hypothetical protein
LISGNHVHDNNPASGPLLFNNSGQTDYIYINNNDVQGPVPGNNPNDSEGSAPIPLSILNQPGVQNRDGTYVTGISLSPAAPVNLEYVTIALKGLILLWFSVASEARIEKLRQEPMAGYTIVKLLRPVGRLEIVVAHSQPDCACEGLVSWRVSSDTAQGR